MSTSPTLPRAISSTAPFVTAYSLSSDEIEPIEIPPAAISVAIEKTDPLSLKEAAVERISSSILTHRIYCPSLHSVMSFYYNLAKTLGEKRACLMYMLHYQRYNAEYTEEESRRLGYPTPLCFVQTQPGYFRTEFNRLFSLFEGWITRNIQSFLNRSFPGNKQPLNTIKICSSTAVSVLKAFYSKDVEVQELGSFCQFLNRTKEEKKSKEFKAEKKEPKGVKKNIILIRITSADLLKTGTAVFLEQLQKIDSKYKLNMLKATDLQLPQPTFLFLLQADHSDVAFIWGASWAAPGKDDTLSYLRLDQVFDARALTLLNEAGAAPDRIHINRFLASQVSEQEEFSRSMEKVGIPASFEVKTLSISSEGSLESWKQKMSEISKFSFKDDPGSEIYRDAIFQWYQEFFIRYDLLLFASPLLRSQVYPWLAPTAGIVEWSKAYQNMCEVVMFCLQSFPEKFQELNFRSAILQSLDAEKKLSQVYQTVHLFPYAMSTIFHIFEHLLSRPGGVVRVGCITQNYFETLDIIVNMGSQGRVQPYKVDSLSEIKEEPDVLVADIHPNNAAKHRLFQNAVGDWVEAFLVNNPSRTLILILDITLNHLSDPLLQRMLAQLVSFVEKGRLEIFGIQSLAKLYQLGADNFSGGLCIYLGSQNLEVRHPKFSMSCREKEDFFALLALHFQHIARRYFDLVRKNTDWMYQTLAEQLSSVKRKIRIYPTEHDRVKVFKEHESYYGVIHNFCVAQVTLNGDENTVYVALSFRPLIDLLNNSINKKLRDCIEVVYDRISQGFKDNMRNANVLIELLRPLENLLKKKNEDIFPKLRDIIAKHRSEDRTNQNYANILDIIKKLEEKQKVINNLANKFKKLILDLAGNRQTPVTGRQSFGFSLSNLSDTVDALRFSIGAEKGAVLFVNAELIAEFSEILSLFIVENFSLETIDDFVFSKFESSVQKASNILNNIGTTLATVDLKEENYDEHGHEVLDKIGVVEIKLTHGRMTFKITREVNGRQVVKTISSDKIYLQDEGIAHEQTSDPNLASYERDGVMWAPSPRFWSTSDLTKLIYKLTSLNHDSVYIMEESKKNGSIYRIYNLYESTIDFGIEESNVSDSNSGIEIEFEPFRLRDSQGRIFNQDHVFVLVGDLGATPVKISRLDEERRGTIFTQCVTYELGLKPHGESSVQLIFKEQKFSLNYQTMVAYFFLHKGGIAGVAKFLAYPRLSDPLNLPLPENYSWSSPKKPLDELYNALEDLGDHLAPKLTTENIQEILGIEEKSYMDKGHFYETCYRRKIFEGIFCRLKQMSSEQRTFNPNTAHIVAENFEKYHTILSFNSEEIDHWIDNMNKKVKTCDNVDWLNPYLVAFFPLIRYKYENSRSLCDLEHSIPLRELALLVKKGFSLLWEHVEGLESRLAQDILDNGRLKSLKGYMGLYARYPLTPNVREALLCALQSKSEEIRSKWIASANFYYDPLDHFHIGVAGDWDELVFEKDDQPRLREFFVKTGCQSILLSRLKSGEIDLFPKALRWAIITQDNQLFMALYEICFNNLKAKKIKKCLQESLSYLQLTEPEQLKLANLVDIGGFSDCIEKLL